MDEESKEEKTKDIAEYMALQYINGQARSTCIKMVIHFYPYISYIEAELMWYAIERYEFLEK